MFATKAFGMGVDIHNIKRTIHFNLSSSVESLYQECGRAGRNNEKADCNILIYRENKDNIDKLFEKPTIAEIKENLEEFTELETLVYFLTSSVDDPKIETHFINILYKYLLNIKKQKNSNIIDFYPSKVLSLIETIIKQNKLDMEVNITKIEKWLYRLFLLGRISMWNVNYGINLNDPNYTNIEIYELNSETEKNNVYKYIKQYDPEYESQNDKNALEELIEWIFNHIIYQRIQSLKTLYELCESYQNSKQFITKIVNYLTLNYDFDIFIKEPLNYKKWFEIFDKQSLNYIQDVLSRYLETYDDFVSLNYISAITRLKMNDFDNTDGKRRLEKSFKDILKLSKEQIKDIILKTYKILTEEEKKLYKTTLLNYNNITLIQILHEIDPDDITESLLILYFSKRIKKIGDTIYDKYRKD